jgi:NAD(P)-dependent dehydrogenase (short-subunit alcohol dehydrogenase family)
MGRVEGKVAIITGGASGIGAACAEILAREGAQVVLTDLDDAQGEALVSQICGSGGRALFLHQDVTDEGRWAEVVSRVEGLYGRLDVLVANAGIGILVRSVTDMALNDWRRQMAVNVDGVFLAVKHVLPAMRRAGHGGSVILMSSIAGIRGSAGLAGYSATKGAVRLFAKAVAMECAGARDSIRVNSVHPGIIDTPIWSKIPAEASGADPGVAIDARQLAASAVPIGELGRAQDVAEGVLFLASDESRYMTGAEIVIDGGMAAGRPGGVAAR